MVRILVHIHSFNDADIIEQTLAAVNKQNRPVDSILIVDNASMDGTLDRVPERVIAIRHPQNVGTSGAVRTGFTYALAHGFDWIWILDADSHPEPDALKNLLDLYNSWPESQQDQTAFLSCLPHNEGDGLPLHGGVFTPLGRAPVHPRPEDIYYLCHVTNWSGCLYRLNAVKAIGLPNADYVLDWGEYEYAYRAMKAGYKSFIHQKSILRHNIRGKPSLVRVKRKLGPFILTFFELPAFRCYYTCRNPLYFAIYEIAEGRLGVFRGAVWRILPAAGRPGVLRGTFWRALLLTLNFVIRPHNHREHIWACVRGIWHGFTGNIAARY
jgi:glycosyltransferase involved in cell wall biosynthesis